MSKNAGQNARGILQPSLRWKRKPGKPRAIVPSWSDLRTAYERREKYLRAVGGFYPDRILARNQGTIIDEIGNKGAGQITRQKVPDHAMRP